MSEKEVFYFKKSHLHDGQEYCEITLGRNLGCGKRGEYMRVSGICAHHRGQLMASAPDLLESLDPDRLEYAAERISGRFKRISLVLREIASKQRAAMKKALGEDLEDKGHGSSL